MKSSIEKKEDDLLIVRIHFTDVDTEAHTAAVVLDDLRLLKHSSQWLGHKHQLVNHKVVGFLR